MRFVLLATFVACFALPLVGCDRETVVVPSVDHAANSDSPGLHETPEPPHELPVQENAATRTVLAAQPAPADRGENRILLRGRVVDVRGESWPEEALSVCFWNDDLECDVPVGEDGRFRLDLAPNAASGYVSIDFGEKSDWRLVSPSELDVSAAAEVQEEFVLEIAERRRGTVLGIAVDDRTGAPLPHLRFEVSDFSFSNDDKFDPIDVETDDAGRFRIEGIVGGGVSIDTPAGEPTPVDDYPDLRVTDDSDGALVELRFHVGATLELELVGHVPADRSSLEAWVIAEGMDWPLLAAAVRHDAEQDRTWVRTDGTGSVYLSFRPAHAPLHLAVGDDAGWLFGAAPFQFDVVDPQTVTVALEPTGALNLVAEREQSGDGLTGDAYTETTLRPLEPVAEDPTLTWRYGRLDWLPAGKYELAVWTRRHERVTRTVEVVAGETLDVGVELSFAKGVRRIVGTARSETGGELADFRISIEVHQKGREVGTWDVSYATFRMCAMGIDEIAHLRSKDTPQVADFDIQGVPPGRLVVDAFSSSYPCEVRVHGEDRGDVEIELLILDDPSGPGFGFRFEETGGWIDRATVSTWVHDGKGEWPMFAESGQILERADPRERDLHWAVSLEGHRPIFGTPDDFLVEGNGRFFVDLAFDPGFGTRVMVGDESGVALGGVSVLADGELVGRTDSNGMFDLVLDDVPKRIEVDAPGMELLSSYPPIVDELDVPTSWYPIVLQPSTGGTR